MVIPQGAWWLSEVFLFFSFLNVKDPARIPSSSFVLNSAVWEVLARPPCLVEAQRERGEGYTVPRQPRGGVRALVGSFAFPSLHSPVIPIWSSFF